MVRCLILFDRIASNLRIIVFFQVLATFVASALTLSELFVYKFWAGIFTQKPKAVFQGDLAAAVSGLSG